MANKQSGISFIEILVILLLISLMTSFVIPRMFTSRTGLTKKRFFSEFTTLISDTLFRAIVTKKVHQIFFDIKQNRISVKQHNPKINESKKEDQFEPIDPNAFKNFITFPDTFKIRNFFIEKNDEVKFGINMEKVWFYIMPDGSSQPVIINIDDDSDGLESQFSIAINPFYSQATLYDTFQKP